MQIRAPVNFLVFFFKKKPNSKLFHANLIFQFDIHILRRNETCVSNSCKEFFSVLQWKFAFRQKWSVPEKVEVAARNKTRRLANVGDVEGEGWYNMTAPARPFSVRLAICLVFYDNYKYDHKALCLERLVLLSKLEKRVRERGEKRDRNVFVCVCVPVRE